MNTSIVSGWVSGVEFKTKENVKLGNPEMKVNVIDVKSKNDGILGINYEYIYTYGNSTVLKLKGNLNLKFSKTEANLIKNEWKVNKKLPDKYFFNIMNLIYLTVTPTIVGIANALGLPAVVVPPFTNR